MHGTVKKNYLALGLYPQAQMQGEWLVENRIERGAPWFRTKAVTGAINARTQIKLVEERGESARFHLTPLTGKKHQLRLHMSGLGFRIMNDRYYPELLPKEDDDFDNPLQLVAKSLQFQDPITGKGMEFHSERNLLW